MRRRWLARPSARLLLASMLTLLACLAPGVAPAMSDRYPGVARAYWVEVNGQAIWAGRADVRLPQASLAKLMTALLVAESGAPGDIVTVSRGASMETGTRLGLRAGERMTTSALLAAALVFSANDACRALADHTAGGQAVFVARMNERARQLKLVDTHFGNACGHDAPDQYSSVRDLAILARAVMGQRAIADVVGLREASVATLGGRRFTRRNTNALVHQLPGAYGLKTGYTPGAGRCLVALARRGDTNVLVVLLHAPDRWWDAAALMELAFDAAPRASRR